MAIVACKECGESMAESSDTPLDRRQPCPRCGSRARSFTVGETDGLGRDDGRESVSGEPGDDLIVRAPTATVGVSAGPAPRQSISDTFVAADHTYTVTHTRTPGGAWVTQVYTADGTLLDMSVQSDATDALLAVIDSILPPQS
jgi:hypothetical protein